jgi:hypothetical protein
MKNNLILTLLLFGIVSMVGCGTLKKVGGYFANIGEAVVGLDKDPEDPEDVREEPGKTSKPFVPTERNVEVGKSLIGWFFFVFFLFGVVYVVRLLYFRRLNKE